MASSKKFASRPPEFKTHSDILNQTKHVCNVKKKKKKAFRSWSRGITSSNVMFPIFERELVLSEKAHLIHIDQK